MYGSRCMVFMVIDPVERCRFCPCQADIMLSEQWTEINEKDLWANDAGDSWGELTKIEASGKSIFFGSPSGHRAGSSRRHTVMNCRFSLLQSLCALSAFIYGSCVLLFAVSHAAMSAGAKCNKYYTEADCQAADCLFSEQEGMVLCTDKAFGAGL